MSSKFAADDLRRLAKMLSHDTGEAFIEFLADQKERVWNAFLSASGNDLYVLQGVAKMIDFQMTTLSELRKEEEEKEDNVMSEEEVSELF